MDALRFAHHFFHFDLAAWKKISLCGQSETGLAKRLFREALLPRRALKGEEPFTFERAFDLHQRLLEREAELGIRALREEEPGYPEALRHLPPERRPAILYVRGAPVPPEHHLVAIVGTRHPSPRGKDAAECFTAYLCALGVRVVSGLARGIDTIAHEQSLCLGTIAVLGAELDHVYPEENQCLAEQILQKGGSLLSPFPLNQVPLPQNFPDRNEIIAALSAGVIVVEGAEKSGAAITGRQALAQGKTVVALTQDFRSEFGRGAISLQREGAELVTREEEAVEAIFRRFGGFAGALPLPKPAATRKTFSFQEFRATSGRSVSEAVALLEQGILQGKIERFGLRYRLR